MAGAGAAGGVLVKTYERKLRFILIGCGRCGVEIGRMALDQGFECVAAVTDKTGLGQDVGHFLGLGKPLGVAITNDLDEALEQVAQAGGADLAFEQTTVYPLEELKSLLLKILNAKLNVASIREDLLFSWDQAPALSAELDAAAKANGVSLVGGGFADLYWLQMMLTLLGGTHRVRRCGFLLRCNIDLYGETMVRKLGMGLRKEEWEKEAPGICPPTRVMQALAAAMGWGWKEATPDLKKTAHTPDRPVPSKAFGRDIQVLRDDEKEENELFVEGHPNARVIFGATDTMGGTVAGMLGRAVATVDAAPGYIPSFKLGAMRELF